MVLEKSAIEKLELELIAAVMKSDIVFLEQIIHDDLLCLAPNGQTITKQMDLDSHRAGQMVVDELHPTIEDIRIVEDCAVCTIVYDTKGKMLGNPISGKYKYIRVWKKFPDGVKVIAASCFQLS
jgi:ketosteroid isomerase-like protein